MNPVAVLGGGNGAHAAVVDLSLRGFDVHWWRRRLPLDMPAGRVRYSGCLGSGEVVATATDDLADALAGTELVVVPLPATAQPELLARLRDILTPDHVVAFLPGTLGSWMGARLRPDVTFLEVGTLPYLTRLTAPGEVAIPVVAARLPAGTVPGEGDAADRAHALFAEAYPMAVRVAHGLDAALTNWGPVIHPPLVVHNLGAIESLGDRFDIHDEGTSPAVRRAVLALDEERIALRKAIGLSAEHWPISTHYDRSPLGMYPPDGHDRLVASGLWRESLHLEHRYLQEDVMCGLVLSASLGRLAGCAMPVSEAILTLLGTALGADPWREGRTAESLGINDLSEATLSKF